MSDIGETFNKKEKDHMRTLKLKATPVAPNFTSVKISVAEQSHRGYSFTPSGDTFIASNGVTLRSVARPEVAGLTFYARGNNIYRDNEEFLVSTDLYNKIKDAVKEYNDKFSKPVVAKTVAPKHIKIAGKALPDDFTKVEVTVLEQTCYQNNFGTADADGKYANDFVHGKIRIASCKDDTIGLKAFMPKRHQGKGMVGTFYFPNSTWGGKTTIVSVEVWNLLRAAVEAYNRHYANWTAPAQLAAPTKRYARRIICGYIEQGYTGSKVGDICEVLNRGTLDTDVLNPLTGKKETWCNGFTEMLPEGFVPAPAAPKADACTYTVG